VQLVVDTDTGIDDALALMLLASVGEVELAHVTTTHGNCSTEASTANARLVLDTCGLGRVPVTGGLSAPLAGELATAWFVHGNDGLGDCGVAPPPAPPAPPGQTAVAVLLDLASTRTGELDLLALGPLTNIGAALREAPDLLRAFRSVTIMGGAGPRRSPEEPDPTLGVGDPNTYHDPEAARLVAAHNPGNVTLVGLDVTMTAIGDGAHLRRIDATTTPHGRLAARISRHYIDFYERNHGFRALALHDPIAAMVAAGCEIDATFVDGAAVVEGPPGDERLVLEPGTGTRALASCDAERAAETLTLALEGALP
jgi:inosine-uridine nucleoside N-ribohydrolase